MQNGIRDPSLFFVDILCLFIILFHDAFYHHHHHLRHCTSFAINRSPSELQYLLESLISDETMIY